MRALRVIILVVVALVVLALGLACMVCAGLSLGGRTDPQLDILTHFAPVYMAGGLVAATAALLLIRHWLRFPLALPGLGAALIAATLILPELSRPGSVRAPADVPHQLKLIQFNAWTYNADPDGSARWIAGQNADLVVIEEPTAQLVDAIERRKGYYVTARDKPVVIFSSAKPVDTGLPPRPNPSWALSAARFGPADGGFLVIGVHHNWPTQWQRQQAQNDDIDDVLKAADRRRAIVVGDFNSTPWSFARRRDDARMGLERRTRAMPTWPARNLVKSQQAFPFPFLPIDHVYAGSDWLTVNVRRGPRLGSDHYPVVVTLAHANGGDDAPPLR